MVISVGSSERDIFKEHNSYSFLGVANLGWVAGMQILAQRELIIGHLVWITVFIGSHSFGLYIQCKHLEE